MGGRGRGSEADIHHPLEPIRPVIRMVRCLVDKDFAVPAFKRRDAKPCLRGPEEPVSELHGEKAFQCRAVVAVPDVVRLVAPPSPQVAEAGLGQGRKHLAAAPHIQIAQLGGGEPCTKAKGQDAAGGGCGDKIEIGADGLAGRVASLELGENRGGKYAAYPAPSIDRIRKRQACGQSCGTRR